MIAQLVLESIPSPSEGVWHIGPVPIRAYALAIILGVFAAIWLGERRWTARGGAAGQVGDVAIWAVPAGLIGARLYHVITDHELYFGEGRDAIDAFKVWQGGLAIWGAIAGGVVGGLWACRHYGLRFRPFLDALAPALLLAQVIGRFGNYFNQELFGRPVDAPWGLEIDAEHRPPGYEGDATFHPTFLYEALWNLGAIGLLLWADKRFKLGFGRVFALYVMAYCAGRAWIENLRIDTVEYSDVLGLRLNVWTSILLFVAALGYFVVAGRRHRSPESREASVYLEGREPGTTDSGQRAAESGQPASSDVRIETSSDELRQPSGDGETPR